MFCLRQNETGGGMKSYRLFTALIIGFSLIGSQVVQASVICQQVRLACCCWDETNPLQSCDMDCMNEQTDSSAPIVALTIDVSEKFIDESITVAAIPTSDFNSAPSKIGTSALNPRLHSPPCKLYLRDCILRL